MERTPRRVAAASGALKRFRPNAFGAGVRLLAVLFGILALSYCLAELAIGYTYMPGKRGGVMLSGGPTVLIAMSALLFCMTSLSVVVDHYDRRDNEALYKRARAWMLKGGVALLVAAPLLELVLGFVRAGSGEVPFQYRGFAADTALHLPAWRASAGEFELSLRKGVVGRLFFITIALAVVIMMADKLKFPVAQWLKIGAALAATLMLSVVVLMSCARQAATGQVRLRDRVYTAEQHPARLNAVLVTRGFTGVFLFAVCGVVAVVFVRKGLPASE